MDAKSLEMSNTFRGKNIINYNMLHTDKQFKWLLVLSDNIASFCMQSCCKIAFTLFDDCDQSYKGVVNP